MEILTSARHLCSLRRDGSLSNHLYYYTGRRFLMSSPRTFIFTHWKQTFVQIRHFIERENMYFTYQHNIHPARGVVKRLLTFLVFFV